MKLGLSTFLLVAGFCSFSQAAPLVCIETYGSATDVIAAGGTVRDGAHVVDREMMLAAKASGHIVSLVTSHESYEGTVEEVDNYKVVLMTKDGPVDVRISGWPSNYLLSSETPANKQARAAKQERALTYHQEYMALLGRTLARSQADAVFEKTVTQEDGTKILYKAYGKVLSIEPGSLRSAKSSLELNMKIHTLTMIKYDQRGNEIGRARSRKLKDHLIVDHDRQSTEISIYLTQPGIDLRNSTRQERLVNSAMAVPGAIRSAFDFTNYDMNRFLGY